MDIVATEVQIRLSALQGSITIGLIISVDQIQDKLTKFLKAVDQSKHGRLTRITAQDIDDIVKADPSLQLDTDDITNPETDAGDVVGPTAAGLGIQGDIQHDTVKQTAVGHHHAKEATTDSDGILPIAVVEAADHLG